MSDARTVKPGEPVRYHNDPRRPMRPVGINDTTSLRAALKEALDGWECVDETESGQGRIAELRKEFGL